MIDARTFFACSDFKSSDGKDILDLDFFLRSGAGGSLTVVETKIHKINGVARFTYEAAPQLSTPAPTPQTVPQDHPGTPQPTGQEHPGTPQ